MEVGESLVVGSRDAWRAWLSSHHQQAKEIWVVCYKKGLGKFSVPYDDLVEEAICFGWVDGMTRSLDQDSYGLRFTPRRKGSNWAESNVQRVAKMLSEGKMTEAGLAVVPAAVLDRIRP
jgi:uncharacterized protein YdeI (YjbR/CyaY-like superfamily)